MALDLPRPSWDDPNGNFDNHLPHQLRTQIYYLTQDPKFETEKPFYSNIPFDHPDSQQTNLESAPYDVYVTDIRGRESQFNLEMHGFQIAQTDSNMAEIYDRFGDPYWIQDNYYPRVDAWLKDALGRDKVDRIYIYDHTVSTSCYYRNAYTTLIRRRFVAAIQILRLSQEV